MSYKKEERKNLQEEIFEEVVAENFSKLLKDNKPQGEESWRKNIKMKSNRNPSALVETGKIALKFTGIPCSVVLCFIVPCRYCIFFFLLIN